MRRVEAALRTAKAARPKQLTAVIGDCLVGADGHRDRTLYRLIRTHNEHLCGGDKAALIDGCWVVPTVFMRTMPRMPSAERQAFTHLRIDGLSLR
jgi:hypothetical protein